MVGVHANQDEGSTARLGPRPSTARQRATPPTHHHALLHRACGRGMAEFPAVMLVMWAESRLGVSVLVLAGFGYA